MESALTAAKDLIFHWNSNPAERFIFDSDRSEINRFLQAVDLLQKSARSMRLTDPNDPIFMAVTRLSREFKNKLTKQTDLLIASSSMTQSSSITDSTSYELWEEYYMTYDGLSKETICDLRRIAERMSSAGRLAECVDAYKTVRKPFVDSRFKLLGIEYLSAADARRLMWDDLKKKIEVWMRAAYVCVRVLFLREKQLYDQIFDGLKTSSYEKCFIETVKDSAIQLFDFAKAVSNTRPALNKLFKILELYNGLSDLLPDINGLFRVESAKRLGIEADPIRCGLGELVRTILSDFVKDVVDDRSASPEVGGSIHPLTKSVMKYISLILENKKILIELIVSNPLTSFGDHTIPDVEFVQLEGRSPLARHLILIVAVLRYNLERKSKSYEDAALVHLFMMNNVHFIVQHIKGCPELKDMIGEDYVNKLSEEVKQAMKGCQESTCVKILRCLSDDGVHRKSWIFSRGSKSVSRERIKSFNETFEEIHRAQLTWAVPDWQLREELRHVISENLIPAYESFLEQFRSHLESRRPQRTHIKYPVEELRTLISTIFFSDDHN